MPTIYDNIEASLLPALRKTLHGATRVDICVGYLRLRGWDALAPLVSALPDSDAAGCRLLIGMQRPPDEIARRLQSARQPDDRLDGPTRRRLLDAAAKHLREQIAFGVPSARAESALRTLARQIREGKVQVKIYLPHPLHAKLYLVSRSDAVTPLIGYVGSSNLTLAGLSRQGELNVDVVEQDAARKLERWFQARWSDRDAIDISDALVRMIEESWAREEPVLPYHVYLKMAYHLSHEAEEGGSAFPLPKDLDAKLLQFQKEAVSLAAHHLDRRHGVVLGDVVGLGKTLMATAVARIMEDDRHWSTLIICPPKLRDMWEWHRQEYRLRATVLSLGKVTDELPALRRRYELVVIDESHNLRNRQGKRYQAILDYVEREESNVMLLSATPYNKEYADLSNQLRLFVDEDTSLHTRPERFFQDWEADGRNDADFRARYRTSPRSLRAFEQSQYPEDWRDLLRHYMVRRTRDYIIRTYAETDETDGRRYVMLGDRRSYFPVRQPKTVRFALDEKDPDDQYARLYSERVVKVLETLHLPRYGLHNYLERDAERKANKDERQVLDNLSRAGARLLGFCRTGLFKRLESSGWSFLLSLHRHILRNMVTCYALEAGKPVPVGSQAAALLNPAVTDADTQTLPDSEDGQEPAEDAATWTPAYGDLDAYRRQASTIYDVYRQKGRFDWLSPDLFRDELRRDLLHDARRLLGILNLAGVWDPARDTKLAALHDLVTRSHPQDKVLVFTQYADTAEYLADQLRARGVADVAVATGDRGDTYTLARRFSPNWNDGLRASERQLRILIATDVLAEGHNLQDGHIVANYDLPWAIIRLVQRAGRVDRIGQESDTILLYSFMQVDGVEQIIDLRRRLRRRLHENSEVIGSDETFFGDEEANTLHDIYTESAGVYDRETGDEVDLTSEANQIWKAASERDRAVALSLPDVIPAARAHQPTPQSPAGVITYLRYDDGDDTLVRVDEAGRIVSQSLSSVFYAARCRPDTPPVPHAPDHHDLVAVAARAVANHAGDSGGALGTRRNVARRVYERLMAYFEATRADVPLVADGLMGPLDRALDAVYRHPLKSGAVDALRRQLRVGISDEHLADMVVARYENETLCQEGTEKKRGEPKVVCSLGLCARHDGSSPDTKETEP